MKFPLSGRLRKSLAAICLVFVVGGIPNRAMGYVWQDAKTSSFSDQDLEFFESKVRPILAEKCFECHGPNAKPLEGGLSLASRSGVIKGGDTGPSIVIGHPDESLLIDAINYGEVYEMPPDTKLPDQEIQILTEWVRKGAPWPAEAEVAIESVEDFDIQKRKKSHWCWKPIRNAKPPEVKNEDWPRDPIDQFILHEIEAAGLTPAKPADRRTLIRRVYFDLVGLPPTPQQVQDFVDDPAPAAFEKVVDQLLASPAFGERWARHWMDLTRYAETYGHEFDYPIAHAYQYRDYLIRAFNEDVPYDQFIEEHIAGDLLPQPRRHSELDYNESILGTGFWFLGEATHSPVDVRENEAGKIDNRIDVMSKSFLGLTVACARCHDHKFDAISTEDYYALAGFLQSSRRQLAMLDPERKIEAAHQDAVKLVAQGDSIVRELVDRLQDVDEDRLSHYVRIALEQLRDDPRWNSGEKIQLPGQDLKPLSHSGGEIEIQELQPQNGLAWSGNKQIWWRDAKPDDTLKLGFELTGISAAQTFEVFGDFAKANDYGAFDISINGNRLQENFDFYAPQLSKTGPIQLGTIELSPGQQSLEFKITGHHPDAIPRNMVGIDWIELRPVFEPVPNQIETVAAGHDLNADLLNKLINAIKSEDSGKPLAIVKWLRESSKSSTSIDRQFAARLVSSRDRAEQQLEKWQTESTLFADFEDGLPAGWFKTGFAFERGLNQETLFAAAGQPIRAGGAIHSGIAGPKMFGVVRSPTFQWDHDQIHYRLRGKNVTLRLIIDGYDLDEHNALLFRGARMHINDAPEFGWHTQSQDIKNHRGHKAYIEIIDHGDGFVELDEIRFSNGARPVESSAERFAVAEDVSEFNIAELAKTISRSCVEQIDRERKGGDRELLAWIVDHGLIDLFQSGATTETSDRESPRSKSRYVSTEIAIPELRRRSTQNLLAELEGIRREIADLNQQTPVPMLAIGMTEGTGEEERIFIRGNHKTLGDVATRRFLSAISSKPLNPPDGSGRLELARKITAPNNPLTSRVAVNRIWHHLMGRGIVESVDNFGVLGKQPTHPELLDHLAKSFMANDWSVKKTIRRIVLTQTYQMSSTVNPEAETIDPNNNLLHRSRIKRLQGEVIRDSILKISGQLNSAMFGPSVPIHLTPFMSGRGRPGSSGPLDGNGRRSIYVEVRRNFLSPMMIAFDTPIPFNAIGKRNQSNVPAQALILMNDPFVVEQAGKWAAELIKQDQSREQRIEQIYLTALGRPPAAWELEKANGFIDQQAVTYEISPENISNDVRLWQDFCHVMFNVKEFIFLK